MKQTDSGSSPKRRAQNIVWTAAREYRFTPVFLAFLPDGEPDFYMNSIIGYVHKWYDTTIMDRLFQFIENSLLKETYDGLLWIALENCAYEKELPLRPVLEELRREHAENFFLQEQNKSRQQWMAQNSLVYALEAAKWRMVLGKDPGLLNPWEKKLFQELQFHSNMDTREIESKILDIFSRYFHFRSNSRLKLLYQDFRRRISSRILKRLPSRILRTEDLTAGRAMRQGDGGRLAQKGSRLPLSPKSRSLETDALYVEGCFGLPMYPRLEMNRLEDSLCRDNHLSCRLYFTNGEKADIGGNHPLVEKFQREAAAQKQKNKTYYESRRNFCQNSIHKLSRQIKDAMLVYPQPLQIPGRSGLLFPSRVWKAQYLEDERIFQDTIPEEQPDFSVSLMLDASASRLDSQESIASQGYIIAKSLSLCNIPLQVFSFLSLRGYTVLRLFSNYGEEGGEEKIFDYCAAGWNRDGLALRGAGHLMEDSPAKNRILILLTDASPNDDVRLPQSLEKGRPLGQDYSGEPAIEDTAREVARLRKDGIRVMAILNGSSADTQAAVRIYGKDFVRIEKIQQLSQTVGLLIQKQIQGLH